MPKKRLAINFRLPPYTTPRSAWRSAIHARAAPAFKSARVLIEPDDRLTVHVQLHLTDAELRAHDVDNRLKDVLDALQGLVSGKHRKHRGRAPLVPNDVQVWRVVVEKRRAPPQSRGLGHVLIRRYVERSPRRSRAGV